MKKFQRSATMALLSLALVPSAAFACATCGCSLSSGDNGQGATADNADSSGTVVYLSPGITAPLGDHLRAFGFAQLPVHSNLAGYQLAPRWSGSIGRTYSF